MTKKTPVPQPSALDRLDPAPEIQVETSWVIQVEPGQAVPPRRELPIGPREEGVRFDLSRFPDEIRRGGVAAGIIGLAQDLDRGFVAGRDAASHQREIRQGLTLLREMAPPARKGDKNDELAARRESRLSGTAAEG